MKEVREVIERHVSVLPGAEELTPHAMDIVEILRDKGLTYGECHITAELVLRILDDCQVGIVSNPEY